MFTDGNPLAQTGDFSATINWGDGTTSPATIDATPFPQTTGPGGSTFPGFTLYTVNGDHTYDTAGSFTAHVTINDVMGTATASSNTQVTVAPMPLTLAASPSPLTATENTPFTGLTVANVAEGGDKSAADFAATIDWGDGSSPTSGQIGAGAITVASGLPVPFGIAGDHMYAESGTYTIHVMVQDDQGTTAAISETISVGEAPIHLTGALDPASDSGVSNADGITYVVQPTFRGTSEPNSAVTIYVNNVTIGVWKAVGNTTADASGFWTITTSTLNDGTYKVAAYALDSSGGAHALITLPNLTIDTVGPRVMGVSIDSKHGAAVIILQDDASGLNLTPLGNSHIYALTQISARPSRIWSPTRVALIPPVTPNSALAVMLTFNKGKKITKGQYVLSINPGVVRDIAGNLLDGEFSGRFPTGNGHPGGDFAMKFKTDGNSITVMPLVPSDPPPKKHPHGKPKKH
jgi:hypothetical protein